MDSLHYQEAARFLAVVREGVAPALAGVKKPTGVLDAIALIDWVREQAANLAVMAMLLEGELRIDLANQQEARYASAKKHHD